MEALFGEVSGVCVVAEDTTNGGLVAVKALSDVGLCEAVLVELQREGYFAVTEAGIIAYAFRQDRRSHWFGASSDFLGVSKEVWRY